MNFSNNLKILRKRYEFSQQRLGLLLDLKHSTISNYEKSTSMPEFATLLKLREIFKIDLETLVFGDVTIISNEMDVSNKMEVTEGCLMAGGCVLRRVAVMENKVLEIEKK